MKILSRGLAQLSENLGLAMQKEGKLSPLRAAEIVKDAQISVEDLEPYADFDHPGEDCYGRKLVVDNGNYEIMVMSWNPDHYSSIHNHGYTQWGVVQVFGNTHHMIYNVKDDELRFSKKEILTSGEIVKVNNKLIHQMGNATTSGYMTLHVYGCNDRDENVTADARNYDLEFNRISHTTGGAFFNLPEDEIYDFDDAPTPTNEVLILYMQFLMSYYNRQPSTPRIEQLKRNALRRCEEQLIVKPKMLLEELSN